MLDPSVTDIGIGVAEGPMTDGGVHGVFYVADFGARGAGTPVGTASKPARACRSRKRGKLAARHRARRIHHTRRCS